MKFVVILSLALIGLVGESSFASLSRNYVCRGTAPGRFGPPKPVVFLTVRGQHAGGNSVFAAVSIPTGRSRGPVFFRELTATIKCTEDAGSKPDYTCTFKKEKYKVTVPLDASGFPQGVIAGPTRGQKYALTCQIRER